MIDAVTAPETWLHMIGRMGGAALLGALVGVDREIRQKPAGLRTHALVALGSALFVMVPLLVLTPGGGVDGDPLARVIQGLVAGIGFVGGGAILQRRSSDDRKEGGEVYGLTTAATIWVSAAIGIAAGVGLWRVAAAAVVLCILVLVAGLPIDALLSRLGRSDAGGKKR